MVTLTIVFGICIVSNANFFIFIILDGFYCVLMQIDGEKKKFFFFLCHKLIFLVQSTQKSTYFIHLFSYKILFFFSFNVRQRL